MRDVVGERETPQRIRYGYSGLLNLKMQPHFTAFVTDFPLSKRIQGTVARHLARVPTSLLFVRAQRTAEQTLQGLASNGIDLQRDYISVQAIVSKAQTAYVVYQLARKLAHSDLASFELPVREPSLLSHLFKVAMAADYEQQDRISDRFFSLLGLQEPYSVLIETNGSVLTVTDSRPWFQLAGKLHEREFRILPAGEVSYTGDRIEGEFLADGTILGIPQHSSVRAAARDISHLGRFVKKEPARIAIRYGRVVALTGKGRAVAKLSRLMEAQPRYINVTEVGISFNSACNRFVHRWPDPSNEARPGVHIGLGGDPSPDDDSERGRTPLVHIDCIAATTSVYVNGRPFLRTSI